MPEALKSEAEPAEKETAEVDFMVSFSGRVIEFWNVEHEIERFMWFQQVLTRHVTPFIFTVNSHNYRISMFNVTIHVHYNCQMWESSVISEIPTNPTKKTYLRLEARILNTTLTNHGSAHYKKIYKWKTACASTTYRITSTYRKRAPYLFRSSIPTRRANIYTCYVGASHTAAAPCQLTP